MNETIASIVEAHRARTTTPADTIARSFERIRARDDDAIFITLRAQAEVIADARALAADGGVERPLFGVPVAIKDNIDVQGLPTTCACPAFAYQARVDATCVARLKRAGAIIIGKTNLDQFATGLNGTRTPYGIPRNPLKPGLIPGGSSSGSAVAVASGLVPLAIGTDTAGSGRVPAMLNNIVGLKPSLGLVSTYGMVPACRTLDCASVFALTVDDAWNALEVMAGTDAKDPYSRNVPLGIPGALQRPIRIGVPAAGARVFFGDEIAAAAYEAALERLGRLGATCIEVDIEAFYETARLLYEGPWVAERFVATRSLLASQPEAMHPVTKEIILGGRQLTAADAFTAFYKLEELRRIAGAVFQEVEALALPTVPTVYTVQQMLDDPIQLNSRLGTYTNFANLLGLCGLAVPASMRGDGIPFGITLLGPNGSDAKLASLGRLFHADTGLPMGALGVPQPPLPALNSDAVAGEIALVVVGAHLSGMPLNDELRQFGARMLKATETTRDYRLYALAGTHPPKPGLLRVNDGAGVAIEVEVWALPAEAFGHFVSAIPSPLSIGTVRLSGGGAAKGFLVEPEAIKGANDISSFGGWRAYLASSAITDR